MHRQDIVMNGKDENYIERVYCGHLFHHGCLDKFMNTPPFQGKVICMYGAVELEFVQYP